MGGDRRFKHVLGAVAGTDLLVRILPELLDLGDTLIVPVGTVLVTRLVLDWALIGWLLSWVLLAMVLFQIAPITFPYGARDWAHGLPGRTAVTVSGITLGVFLEKAILEWTQIGQSPFPYRIEPLTVGVVFAGLVVLFTASLALPPLQWGTTVLYRFDENELPVESGTGASFFGSYLLLVVVIGLMLAEISLLFPLPEVLILGVSVYDIVGYKLRSIPALPARRDVAQRLVIGVAAIWSGFRGAIWVIYNVAGLLAIILINALYIRGLHLWQLPAVRPVDAAFAFFTLGGATVLATVSIVRLIERIPVHYFFNPHFEDQDAVEADTHLIKPRPRVPGFMIPAGLLFGSLELARPNTGRVSIENLPPLELTGTVLLIAAIASVLGVATVFRPAWFPALSVSDYYAGPVSLANFLALGFWLEDIIAIPFGEPALVIRNLTFLVTGYCFFLSPILGFEYTEQSGTDIAANIVEGIKLAVSSIIFYFVLLVISMVVIRLLPVSFSPPIAEAGRALATVPVVVFIASLCIRLLFVPFYIVEIGHDYL